MTMRGAGPVAGLAGLAAVLVAACAWLASGVGREPSWLTPDASAATVTRAQESPVELPPPVELQALSHAWRTPLFSPSRSPDAAQRGLEPGPELGGLKLTGIVIAEGVRQALFKQADGKDLALREGAVLGGGWRLRRIEEQAVHFELDERSQRLRLPAPRLPNMNDSSSAASGSRIHPPPAFEGH